MTKINERRHVPLCDRLIDLLRPVRRESGPVIDLKKPEDETARLQRVTGIQWRRNALRHSFCSYRVAITGDSAGVYRVRQFGANDQAMLLGC
jgi:hypothetical protein